MNFFDKVHETQITRTYYQPRPVPMHRRLFAVGPFRETKRAAQG